MRSLPEELLDHIVDHLYDSEDALKSCCIVSKSWILRTQRHLFARVSGSLKSWKERFLDSSTSPAYFTEYLRIDCPQAVASAEAGDDGWISTFSRVTHLEVYIRGSGIDESLTPLREFSTTAKSLCATFFAVSPLQIINFIYSFPLLDDLCAIM